MAQQNQLGKPTFTGITSQHQQFLSQMVDTVNSLAGYNGTAFINNSLDVQGNNVQNVANPVAPTDALNLQTAEAKYSPAVVGAQLDVGGKTPLKGLTYLYQQDQKGLNVTITTAKLTSGGTEGSMTFVKGKLVAQVQAT
jgi:hypothetical protein